MMSGEQVREEIRRAVGVEWPEFEARHPRLAAELDREVVVQSTAARLADDPEYQKALAAAELAGQGLEALAELIRGRVRGWLERWVM